MSTAAYFHSNSGIFMKIVAVIPAHMASVRFPGKILFPIHGLPMIEHVRRRAIMSESLAEVIVATCDNAIASLVRGFGGKVVMTANTHKNGTTRVAEVLGNRFFLMIAGFWLLHVLGLLWSSELDFGLRDIRVKLPLLVIPFLLTIKPLKEGEVKPVVVLFLVSTLITSLLNFVFYQGCSPDYLCL